MPQYSIILPVKNGGNYLKECIAGILSQTYTDFDLLVLDNSSTDGTLEYLKSINDRRVKIYPSDRSLTIEENWGRIKSIEKNEFITLIGHDDLLEKDYLETMNDLILKFPDATLYQTHFRYIDSDGGLIRQCKPMAEKESASDFLAKYLKKEIDVMGTGFMMRSAEYDQIGGIPDYPNLLFADFELWINLSIKGYKETSAKECFSFRIHQSTTAVSADLKYHYAFERFVLYLSRLKNENKDFARVINDYAAGFLLFYCRGFAHRVLRTAKKNREGLSVKGIIYSFNHYAIQLGLIDKFHPKKEFSLMLAFLIDSTSVGRNLFLIFKSMFKKPILK